MRGRQGSHRATLGLIAALLLSTACGAADNSPERAAGGASASPATALATPLEPSPDAPAVQPSSAAPGRTPAVSPTPRPTPFSDSLRPPAPGRYRYRQTGTSTTRDGSVRLPVDVFLEVRRVSETTQRWTWHHPMEGDRRETIEIVWSGSAARVTASESSLKIGETSSQLRCAYRPAALRYRAPLSPGATWSNESRLTCSPTGTLEERDRTTIGQPAAVEVGGVPIGGWTHRRTGSTEGTQRTNRFDETSVFAADRGLALEIKVKTSQGATSQDRVLRLVSLTPAAL